LEQVRWLVEHGVWYGQGYLFAKPLSVDDFIEFVRAKNGGDA